jgi:uncharacterized protein (TIGR03083 family)
MDVNSLGERPDEWRGAFAVAARWFADMAAYAVDALERPGLGEWTVRDLVGHTSRSLITVETYLSDDPGLAVDIPTTVAYYVTTRSADPAQVAERGRAAGAALGDDPAAAIAALVERVPGRVDAAADDARLVTPFGTMTLAEYLPTRTFELTVHTGDLLRALDHDAEPPAAAARSALRLAADLTADGGRATAVLATLTGRATLQTGYSVL